MSAILRIPARFGAALVIAAVMLPQAALAQVAPPAAPPADAAAPATTIRGTFVPVRVSAADLETNIALFENMFGLRNGLRFKFPEHELEFAIIGPVALIAGSDAAQRHLPAMQVIFTVDSLATWRERLVKSGATVLQEASSIPTGMNMFVRTPGGQIFEYVQINPQKVQAVNLIKPR